MEKCPALVLKPEVAEFLKTSISACCENNDEMFPSSSKKMDEFLAVASRPPMFTSLRLNTMYGKGEENFSAIEKFLNENEMSRSGTMFHLDIHPLLKDCIIIRNQGPFVLKPVEKEVIVDRSCGSSVMRGSDIFIPGVLSMTPSVNKGDKVSVYIDVEAGCRRGLVKKFHGNKLFLGNGVAMVSRGDVFEGNSVAKGVGISMTDPILKSPRLSDLPSWLIFPQNLPSIVCSHVLDPRPSDIVLDMCCAPGGKTSHIASLMENKGRVIALDKSRNKMEKTRENASSWGLSNVEIYNYDSCALHDPEADLDGPPPYPGGSFDRILLDAPCSALGQRPTIVNDISLSQLSSYPVLQKRLMETAVKMLKAGGTIVYSTCTVNVLENEAIVAWALNKFPELKLAKQEPHLGGKGWKCKGLTEDQTDLLQRFNPTIYTADDPNSDTIGFFIAKFKKT